jgi:hypothetical protein
MRLAIAATTLLLCFGLVSCGDDGDSKPIGGPSHGSQACKCKPGDQGAPQLKPQVTDGGSGKAHAWQGRHRNYAGGHASWAHHRGRYEARWHYTAHEHRYAAHEHGYAVHEDRYAGDEHRRHYTERGRWHYSHREYAPQPFLYDYVSRSHRSNYSFSEREEYRGSGPCCRCHRGCDGGDGYSGGYRPPMSINDPAALDPWQGYGDGDGFAAW